jgi:gluconolactonase
MSLVFAGICSHAPGITGRAHLADPALKDALHAELFALGEAARLWAFDITAPGEVRREGWPSPHGGRMVCAAPGGHYQRFDSLAVDSVGNVCVATLIHGGISIVAPDGRCTGHVALPDRFTTNLCFGGPDRRTAFVTLSGSGRLIAIDGWPVPGLKLNYEA